MPLYKTALAIRSRLKGIDVLVADATFPIRQRLCELESARPRVLCMVRPGGNVAALKHGETGGLAEGNPYRYG